MILGVYTILDARQNVASPTANMSRPCDEGNNIQTCEAGATSQLAESASHDLPGGHSVAIEKLWILVLVTVTQKWPPSC